MYSPSSASAGHIRALMESMSVEDRIGQMIMVGFDGQSLTPELESHLNEIHAGNVIFLGRNYANPQQMWDFTNALQSMASRRPAPVGLFTAIDQEGGVVARLLNGVTVFPGSMALGATGRADYARRAAKVTSQEMMQLGLNMNLAPVLDVNNNPGNPAIGVRSYGESPELVGVMGAETIAASQFGAFPVRSHSNSRVTGVVVHVQNRG